MIDKLILASSSKQRISLLQQIKIVPGIMTSSDIDESFYNKELPKDYSIRMAKEKADKVSLLYPNHFVLSADTVAACGRRILMKPEKECQAIKCMNLISGRRHRVYTTICLKLPDGKCHIRTVLTVLKIKRLLSKEIDEYIASEQWKNRAGGFNIQGLGGLFVVWLQGSYSSVMGLPLYETYCVLRQYFAMDFSF